MKEVKKMRNSEEGLKALREWLGYDVREFEESGYSFVYLPGLKMPPGCLPVQTDALLCPQPHSGYSSRLFFKERVKTPKPVNWNGQVFVLGHQWYAFSYSNVINTSLLDMVINHLRGMVA